jgi:hypothetical protein
VLFVLFLLFFCFCFLQNQSTLIFKV